MNKKQNVCFFDIETGYLTARVWRTGKQVVRPDQLIEKDTYKIICICYAFNDEPVQTIHWGLKEQNSAKVIKEFDKIIKRADVVIGKNSDRFDIKHINSVRCFSGLPSNRDWAFASDDLEKQLRKHFYLPSFSLDYVSSILGLGGKNPMTFQDWIDIIEHKNKKALDKMIRYCKKDVSDTRKIWNYVKNHIAPKNRAIAPTEGANCWTCGSSAIHKNGTRIIGSSVWQTYYCNNHGGYAGRLILQDHRRVVKLRQ